MFLVFIFSRLYVSGNYLFTSSYFQSLHFQSFHVFQSACVLICSHVCSCVSIGLCVPVCSVYSHIPLSYSILAFFLNFFGCPCPTHFNFIFRFLYYYISSLYILHFYVLNISCLSTIMSLFCLFFYTSNLL